MEWVTRAKELSPGSPTYFQRIAEEKMRNI